MEQPAIRSVEARQLPKSVLPALFEPNEDIGYPDEVTQGFCAYDNIAHPTGAYYLIAERGAGKTHIVELLRDQLRKRKDIALEITSPKSAIRGNHKKLTEQFPGPKSLVWELAILEEVAVHLCHDHRLAPVQSRVLNQLLPRALKRRLDLNRDFFNYLRIHRAEDWEKRRDVWTKIRAGLIKRAEGLNKLLPGRVRISFVKVVELSLESKESTQSERHETLSSLDEVVRTSTLDERVRTVEEWVWATLRDMQSVHAGHRGATHESFFTRYLPGCPCVYVIADRLDQDEEPLGHDEIRALLEATRNLNEAALDELGQPPDEIPNFKAILAMRAVTFRDYIKPQVKDWEQLKPKKEELRWSKTALQRMMARRIYAGQPLPNDRTAEDIILDYFPKRIHYFGREFDPSIEFVFEHTGMRPRQVLLFWQKCADQTGGPGSNPYTARLTEEHVVRGMQSYAEKDLPDDIGNEYELEYYGLNNHLFKFLASSRGDFDRRVSRSVLERKIKQFQQDPIVREGISEDKKSEKCEWLLETVPAYMIEVLCRVGVLGIPTAGTIHPDWPSANYVHDRQNLTTRGCDKFCVRPSFWYFMTNIRRHIEERRNIHLGLYRQLKSVVDEFDAQFDSLSANEDLEFQYTLGTFLALGRQVLSLGNYPEPKDWEDWTSVSSAIKESWSRLADVGLIKVTGRSKDRADNALEGIAAFFELQPQSEATTTHAHPWVISWNQFHQTISNDRDYQRKTRSVRLWFKDYLSGRVDQQSIEDFRNSLVVGVGDSLSAKLGKAIDRLEGLYFPAHSA